MTQTPVDPIDCIWDANALLGEGPVWDDQSQELLWLDIKGRQLFRYHLPSRQQTTIPLSLETGAVALRQSDGLIAATRDGFGFLDPDTGEFDVLHDPESGLTKNRFNDGKCDKRGRFIAGTMDDTEQNPTGSVYRFDDTLQATKLFGGYVVCNGPAFSPDGKTLYFSDSANRTLWAFDYNEQTGTASDPRLFATIDSEQGYPDGLTVDAQGYLWCCHWDGGRITRFSPDGQVERVIAMPVPRPTSCTFGGDNLDCLFVTSARIGLDEAGLEKAPHSGAAFAVKVGIKGLPAARFNG